MNRLFRVSGLLRGMALLLAVLMVLSACTSPITPPGNTDGEGITTPDASSDGVLTLPADETQEESDPIPPVMTLDPSVPYGALVITSYYAAGRVAGKAMVDASYVELHNGSDTPISLAGLSLYVSDRGEAFTEYRFSAEDSIPANGFFLVRGADANGNSKDALSVDSYDKRFKSLSPDPDSTRIVLTGAGLTIPTDKPLADLEDLFSYVTSHPLDAADTYRYIDSASVNKVIRKKADPSG